MFGSAKEAVPYIDLHCHILPGMDDGAQNTEESICLIRAEMEDGCRGLVMTPHYYAEETIEAFLTRRKTSFEELKAALEKEGLGTLVSSIALGAETAYHGGLVYDPDLPKLCLGRSNVLLLEMPFSEWTNTVVREVSEIIRSRGLRVVIAHLERYMDFVSQDALDTLLELDVLVQMNIGCVLRRHSRKTGLSFMKYGITQVLGTDTHNMEWRPPRMAEGIAFLKKNGYCEDIQRILLTGEKLFAEAI